MDCVDDGNLCNGLAFCDKSLSPPTCGSTPAIVCTPGGVGCANTACNAKSGQCEDNPKNNGCDDSNDCSLDSCTAKGVCVNSALADGNPCGGGVCVSAKCQSAPNGMAFVPSGTAWIGCNSLVDVQCAVDEWPTHLIELSAIFADRYEVSAGEFAACINAGACEKPAKIDAACNIGTPSREQNPANCVTFLQAAAYCKFAERRLPTEAEWESLARGRCFSPDCKEITPRFPWGNQPVANCNYAWMAGSFAPGCNLGTTLAVGARPLDKSPYGLFDMAGNVREWTMDSYDIDFYKKLDASKANPVNLSVSSRVVRGGGILSQSKDMRTSRRDSLAPSQAASDVGFRCVRDPNP